MSPAIEMLAPGSGNGGIGGGVPGVCAAHGAPISSKPQVNSDAAPDAVMRI
jgi:hypothetical protein